MDRIEINQVGSEILIKPSGKNYYVLITLTDGVGIRFVEKRSGLDYDLQCGSYTPYALVETMLGDIPLHTSSSSTDPGIVLSTD